MAIATGWSPYGWKARIGLIVPSTNTVNEPEFWRLAAEGVSIHTARVLAEGPSDEGAFQRMEERLDLAAQQLETAEVDVLAYGCTTGSIICPGQDICSHLTDIARAPTITTSGAVVAALRAMGVRRVAVGTPYNTILNTHEREFLIGSGFDVVALESIDVPENCERRRAIGKISEAAVYRLGCSVDRPDADAIFLSCTNLATLGVIEALEDRLQKPVITSNQATYWSCAGLLGLESPSSNFGRLFSLPCRGEGPSFFHA
ncbi:Arylmalonate decarboxylase [Bordetella sputigena]|uniref:maleate cis-trans isomerase family protein n=1 Tax=Bordetella sputigena TaxID=1416810 RepID=UPI0039EEBC7F